MVLAYGGYEWYGGEEPIYPGAPGDTWCASGWNKRIDINVNNTAGSALTDYQVYVNLSANPINETSLRVYNATSCTLRPHWTENETGGNSYGVWINYSTIAASSWTNNTAIYYDNVAVSSASNGTNTFEFFDDFSTDTISSSLKTIVSNLGTKMATMDSQMTHKVARDSSGYIYFTYKDSNYYSYIAKSQYPNSLEGTWTTQKLFGGAGALLGNLLIAKFGSSIVIDTSTDELSFVQVEKTNHYCIYSRCNLTGTGGITNASNWYKEGAPNPTTQGYQQIGSIGAAATTQLAMVTHDGDGKAMVAYGETTGGTYYVKYAWYNTSWPTPITLSSYSDYEWAIDLIWTANDKCHIAWESYETDTVKYKKCVGVANSMTASNWKKADESTAGYDNAIFHSTHECRGFSMVSDSNYNLYFVGQTTHATENCLLVYNVLTESSKTWKFTSGSCGLVSDGGLNNMYQYNQLGLRNDDTPIDVYVKEMGDNKAYYRTYNGTDWSGETEIISGTAAATYPIIERKQPAGQTTMPIFWTKYGTQYDIVGAPLPSTIGIWSITSSESGDAATVTGGYLDLDKAGVVGTFHVTHTFSPAKTKMKIGLMLKPIAGDGLSFLTYLDTSYGIFVLFDLTGNIFKYYSGSSYHTLFTGVSSQWYHIFLDKIDCDTDTYDLYVYDENWILKGSQTGIAFQNAATDFDTMRNHLYNADTQDYRDNIYVCKYASPDPSATLGAEEQYSATTPVISNVANGSISATSQWIDWDVNQTTHNQVVYDKGDVGADSTACEGQWSATHACANASDGNWSSYAESAGAMTSYAYFNYTVPTAADQSESLWHIKGSADDENMTVPSACWGGTLYLRARCNDIANSVLWQCDNGPGWTTLHTSVANIAYEQEMKFKYVSSWDNSTAAPNITLSGLIASTLYEYQAWSYNTSNTSLSDNSSTLNFTTAAGIDIIIKQWIDVSSYNNTHVMYNLTTWAYNNYTSSLNISVDVDANWTDYNINSLAPYASDIHTQSATFVRPLSDANFTAAAAILGDEGAGTSNNIKVFLPVDPPSKAAGDNDITILAGKRALFCNWSGDQTFQQMQSNLTNTTDYFWYNSTSQKWTFYNVSRTINQDTLVDKHNAVMVCFNKTTTVSCNILSAETITIPSNVWYYTALRESASKTLTEINTAITADGCTITDSYAWNSPAGAYTNTGSYSVLSNEGFAIYCSVGCNWDGSI